MSCVSALEAIGGASTALEGQRQRDGVQGQGSLASCFSTVRQKCTTLRAAIARAFPTIIRIFASQVSGERPALRAGFTTPDLTKREPGHITLRSHSLNFSVDSGSGYVWSVCRRLPVCAWDDCSAPLQHLTSVCIVRANPSYIILYWNQIRPRSKLGRTVTVLRCHTDMSIARARCPAAPAYVNQCAEGHTGFLCSTCKSASLGWQNQCILKFTIHGPRGVLKFTRTSLCIGTADHAGF